MKKEVRPGDEHIACEVCGRTILKGERTEAYLAPDGQRREVCELCSERAQQQGWVRESAVGDVPAKPPRGEPRRSLLARLRGRPAEPPPPAADDAAPGRDEGPVPAEPREAVGATPEGEPGAPREETERHPPTAEPPAAPPRRPRPKDTRHVRAVPTTAEVKVARALELFNSSEHRRTIAGLARTLGAPWVSAVPDSDQTSGVTLLVAWELSWYRYRVDLGDEADPVGLLEKGDQLDQIDEPLRRWNGALDAEGRLSVRDAGEGTGP